MTIRELKTHVDSGFERVDQRFDQVDRRFTKTDERFEALEKRIAEEHATTRRHFDVVAERLEGTSGF